jgi:hypothetical protein
MPDFAKTSRPNSLDRPNQLPISVVLRTHPVKTGEAVKPVKAAMLPLTARRWCDRSEVGYLDLRRTERFHLSGPFLISTPGSPLLKGGNSIANELANLAPVPVGFAARRHPRFQQLTQCQDYVGAFAITRGKRASGYVFERVRHCHLGVGLRYDFLIAPQARQQPDWPTPRCCPPQAGPALSPFR